MSESRETNSIALMRHAQSWYVVDAAEDRSTYRDLTKAGVDSAIGVGQRFGELLTEMGWDTGVVVYDVGTKQSMQTPAVVRRQLGHDEP